MQEIPTDLIALKTWWAFTWRALLAALASGIAVGIIVGLIGSVFGAEPQSLQGPSTLAGGLLGAFVSVKVMKYLMTKGFGQYRLMVVRK